MCHKTSARDNKAPVIHGAQTPNTNCASHVTLMCTCRRLLTRPQDNSPIMSLFCLNLYIIITRNDDHWAMGRLYSLIYFVRICDKYVRPEYKDLYTYIKKGKFMFLIQTINECLRCAYDELWCYLIKVYP